MTIAEGKEASKALLGRIPADLLAILALILCTTLAFGLGILAGKDMAKAETTDGFWIEQLPEGQGGPAAAVEALKPIEDIAAPAPIVPEVRTYMASKNGTKYYLPTCGSAKRIKEENRVWFGTKAEAEAAGYSPAANCPGL
jgi:hypothetical protein